MRPFNVADGCHDTQCHRDIHAGDRHQPLDPWFLEGRLCEALVNLCKFSAKAIEFTGMAKDNTALILGERLSLQPSPAPL
ncbi:MAG: hypothetical protein E5V18_25060 [Mesorhizobium sp.]|nr:MAG: hypothetical protein E5V18_25060 [Mesorhizobium sp.]